MFYKKGLKVCNFIKKRIFLKNVAEFLRKHNILEKIMAAPVESIT